MCPTSNFTVKSLVTACCIFVVYMSFLVELLMVEAVVKKVESQKTDTNSRPLEDCVIVHCGELVQAKKAKKKAQ